MGERKWTLPETTGQRRGPEVVIEMVNVDEERRVRELKYRAAEQAINAIPDIVEIARTYVEIQQMKVQSDETVRLMQEKAQLLKEETKNFLAREIEKRNSFQARGVQVQELLRDLYRTLEHSRDSEEVKTLLIKTVDQTMAAILEEMGHDR